MTTVTILAVGGTGETHRKDPRTAVSGMLAQVTDRLDERFDCRWVRYPASYGPVPRRNGISYRESVAAGVDNLRAEMARASGPVMLIGYSQGAVVIRQLLATTHADVAAVGFVADPYQPPGVVAGCDGFGLAGHGPDLPEGLPALWIGHPGDVICNASDDSLLRDLADLTATFSTRDVRGWFAGLWHILRSNSFRTRRGHRCILVSGGGTSGDCVCWQSSWPVIFRRGCVSGGWSSPIGEVDATSPTGSSRSIPTGSPGARC
jgi:pimeloyl-ACP methyl ester carboxylesterase